MDQPDLQDIQQSLRGDGEAYARLVRRYQGQVAAQMWRFTRDRQELEELVQDVFVEAYRSLGRFRGQAPLLHWLRTIATRTGYRFWKERARQQRQTPLPELDVLAAPPDKTLDQREAAELLEILMAGVSPSDRLVLSLLHLEELSVAEIARRTGWTRISVKVRAHRARKRLKELLDKRQRDQHNRSISHG